MSEWKKVMKRMKNKSVIMEPLAHSHKHIQSTTHDRTPYKQQL